VNDPDWQREQGYDGVEPEGDGVIRNPAHWSAVKAKQFCDGDGEGDGVI
jgi:hypothetical protein